MAMSQKRRRGQPGDTDVQSPSSQSEIFRSASIEDRSSKFIAFYSPSIPAKALQELPELDSASHRIAAWRNRSKQTVLSFRSTSTVIYDTGSDDDGEKWAGKRLENVLKDTDTQGAVVVARWYGGVLLGPVRFTHIERCAREAILACRQYQDRDFIGDGPAQKLRKIEEGGSQDKVALVRNLQKRDESVLVLRGLLREKMVAATKSSIDVVDPPSQTSTKSPNYSTMSLQALKQLDRARDATIGWIIKKIDEAEDGQNTGFGKKQC